MSTPRCATLAFVLAWSAAPCALAQVPQLLGYQGRLVRADGTAATGTATVVFALHDAATAGSTLWTETQTLGLSDGYYATFLGLVTALPTGIFDGGARWLEVRVGSETLTPRQQVGSVAFAFQARSVAGGGADVTSLKVAGATVVDASGRLAGTARYLAGPGLALDASTQTMSLQACPTGQALVWDSTAWQCTVTVTSVGASAPLSISGAAATPQLSMSQAGTGSSGYLSSADWTSFNAKFGATTTCGGDLTGSLAAPVVARLQSRAVASTTPQHGQVLKWNATGSQWEPAPDAYSPGTVTDVIVDAPLTAYNGSTVPHISIAAAGSGVDGYLTAFEWARFNDKYDASTSCGGDLRGALAAPEVAAIRGVSVVSTLPAGGQVLRFDGSAWVPASLQIGDVSGLSSGYLDLTGAQDVAGAKTFQTAPSFSTPLETASGGIGTTTAAANAVFAGPDLSSGAPGFRALAAADIPSLDADKITTGTLGVARGGTGTSAAFAAGSVVFAGSGGGYSQNAAKLVWDDTNGRLGVGTATPAGTLDVATGQVLLAAGSASAPSLSFSTDPDTGLATEGAANHLRFVVGGTRAWSVTSNLELQAASTAQGRIYNGYGSAAYAAYGFSGNENTGLFRPAANTVGITLGGTERARFVADGGYGVLGIGTGSPVYPLSVDTAGQNSVGLYRSGVLTHVLGAGSGGEGYMYVNNAGTAKVLIDTAGASYLGGGGLGVGLTSPSYRLHVHGASAGNNYIHLTDPASGTASADGVLVGHDSGGNFEIYNQETSGNIQFWQQGANRYVMTLKSGGNVGIGTTAPSQKLEVYDSMVYANRPSAANGAIAHAFYSTLGADATLGALNVQLGGYPSATGSSRYGYLDIADGASGRTLALNPTGGAVGVGRTAPMAALDVNGAVRMGDDSTTCTSANAGALRWNGARFEGCDGTAWQPFAIATVGTQTNPAASCKAIKDAGSTSSGLYWLSVGGSTFQTYCDMVTDGGGWTLVGNWAAMSGYAMYNYGSAGRLSGELPTSYSAVRPGGTASGQGPAHLSSAVVNALFGSGQAQGQYLSLTGTASGGYVLARFTKALADTSYDAYRGVYQTQYMKANGFTLVTVTSTGTNANPLPVASPSWASQTVNGRTCSDPPAGVDCFHYLPDDVTGGGQWLFRENADDTPTTAYSGSGSVPSLLFIRALPVGPGGSQSTAGSSCKALKDAGVSASGVYWINPGGTAFKAYCDMVTDGGGWTFAGNWASMAGYDMYSYRTDGRLATETVGAYAAVRPGGTAAGQGPTHYSSTVMNALFQNGQRQYLVLTGTGSGGYVLAKFTKTSADAGYDAYKGVYRTEYMKANGFTLVTVASTGTNSNPLPVASPSFASATVNGRACADPPGGVNCYHYLPDDVGPVSSGEWLFRENIDDTPTTAYGGSSGVPSLLFIR